MNFNLMNILLCEEIKYKVEYAYDIGDKAVQSGNVEVGEEIIEKIHNTFGVDGEVLYKVSNKKVIDVIEAGCAETGGSSAKKMAYKNFKVEKFSPKIQAKDTAAVKPSSQITTIVNGDSALFRTSLFFGGFFSGALVLFMAERIYRSGQKVKN